jgi:uroporphyrinogen decarboxylase
LNPNKGFLAKQLEVLQLLIPHFSPHTPVIQTIFNPMSQAKNLAGQDSLLTMMRSQPDLLHAGLITITRSTIDFIHACMDIGIDGVFFAVQHAQSNLLSDAEFDTFCRPYDLEILDVAKNTWLNMVHIHGEGIYFAKVAKYPVQILNWHDRHTSPGIDEARRYFNGVFCGGLSRIESLVLGDPVSIKHEAENAIRESGGSRFILGTGCVVPITAPYGNIAATRNSVFQA